MTRPTPRCTHMYECDDGYMVEGHGWESVPTFYCRVTTGLCIFNTEDWAEGYHHCPHVDENILVEEA